MRSELLTVLLGLISVENVLLGCYGAANERGVVALFVVVLKFGLVSNDDRLE